MDPPEISIPDEHKQILSANVLGVLSTVRAKDGLISSNPVGYVLEGERVCISTAKHRVKYRSLVADPRVCFCVVDHADPTRYVELRGHATLEDDPGSEFLRRAFPQMSGGAEMPEDLDAPGTERVVVRIHPHQSSSPRVYGGRRVPSRQGQD